MKLKLYWQSNKSSETRIQELSLLPRTNISISRNTISTMDSLLENGYYEISLICSKEELYTNFIYLYLNH